MSRARPLLHLLPELVRTLLSAPITVRFPFAPMKPLTHLRGKVVIDAECCTGCGQCVRDCPALGLELLKNDRQHFRLIHYPDRCAYCGQCEDSCRSGAIGFTSEFPRPSPSRASLTHTLVSRD